MDIQILTDDALSWFVPYGYQLMSKLLAQGHRVSYVSNKNELKEGDICFLLSCSKLIPRQDLDLHRHNIVVHASDLPQGKGFSPLQWQILEGYDRIVLTLFEAVEACDAGPYYLKEELIFDGTELYYELREKLACKIVALCLSFVRDGASLKAIPQSGIESVYARRTTKDDMLDINKTIAEQFNHLRIADNEKHPLLFVNRGCTYKVKIYKATK